MTIQKVAMEQQQADMQNQQAMNDKNIQANMQIAQENREDAQVNEKDNINLKTQGQIAIENVKAKNKMFENQHKAENDLLNSQNVTDM